MRLFLLIGLSLCVSSQARSFYLSDTVANYGLQHTGTVHDKTFLFINPQSSKKPYIVEQIGLSLGTDFSVVNISQKLPYQANPGDTVYYTVKYTVKDTTTHFDTIYVKTDCDFRQKIVKGEGGCGILVASDHTFGRYKVGTLTHVDTVSVKNVGKLPATLYDEMIFTNTVFRYSIAWSGTNPIGFPWIIEPNNGIELAFIYEPTNEGNDTGTCYLRSNGPQPVEKFGKPFVKFKGIGTMSGVEWNIDSLILTTPSDSTIKRVFLRTNHSLATEVKEIFINGPDEDEFFIYQTQRPIEGGVVIDTADSIWVDVGFKPDLSKPSSYVRIAYLNTYDKSNNEEMNVIAMRGVVSSLGVLDRNESNVTIHPNPARDYVLISGDYKDIKLFDALGREVKLQVNYHAKPIRIELNELPSGAYNLQLKDASGQVVLEKLIIE